MASSRASRSSAGGSIRARPSVSSTRRPCPPCLPLALRRGKCLPPPAPCFTEVLAVRALRVRGCAPRVEELSDDQAFLASLAVRPPHRPPGPEGPSPAVPPPGGAGGPRGPGRLHRTQR